MLAQKIYVVLRVLNFLLCGTLTSRAYWKGFTTAYNAKQTPTDTHCSIPKVYNTLLLVCVPGVS